MTEFHTVYEEIGAPGNGDTLMLLHPLGGSIRFWDWSVRCWEGRHRLIAYDRAGSGRSPAPAHPQSMAESIAELEALRQSLELERIVPVGVAIGAMIAAGYAAAHPASVSAAVLCNPALKVSAAGRTMTRERVEKLRANGIEALLPAAVDRAFNGLDKGPAYDAYLEQFAQNDALGYEASALATLDLDITFDIERVTAPSLVLVGEHDVLFPPQDARAVAAKLRNAHLRIIPGAAHFPPLQTPAAFVAAVDDFMAGI